MNNNCKRHNRHNCSSSYCRNDSSDNLGDIGINTQGDLTMGMGNGLAIDLEDGSLGFDLGGFVIDTDSF